MPRSIEEWTGKTHDSAIPDRVKLRILNRQRNSDGLPICPDCTNAIRPGQAIHFDHAVPLIDGGEHSEGNLRAIHVRPCHNAKTAKEAHARAEERAQALSVYGLRSKTKWGSRGFQRAQPQRSATREIRRKSEAQGDAK
jgi:5-methylcytosine-specific restriction endonuclease McrA